MVDIMELPKARVNASMLTQYIDRPVCFVGKLEKIHPTGKMFILSDGEGKSGTVELMEPEILTSSLSLNDFAFNFNVCSEPEPLLKLDEEISGIIEVVGKVTAKGTILCASYILFKEDCNRFDLELYNEAVKIINEFPQFFPLGLTQHE